MRICIKFMIHIYIPTNTYTHAYIYIHTYSQTYMLKVVAFTMASSNIISVIHPYTESPVESSIFHPFTHYP